MTATVICAVNRRVLSDKWRWHKRGWHKSTGTTGWRQQCQIRWCWSWWWWLWCWC